MDDEVVLFLLLCAAFWMLFGLVCLSLGLPGWLGILSVVNSASFLAYAGVRMRRK